MHFRGLVPSLLYLASSQIVFYYWFCCYVFLQSLLDVLVVFFVQFHFLLLSPLGHHYPLNKHRKLCSPSPLWIYSILFISIWMTRLVREFRIKTLFHILFFAQLYWNKYYPQDIIKWDRNASWQTSKATCEWLECIRSQNGGKMFPSLKEMVWKGCSQNCFVRGKDVWIRIRDPESRRKLFWGVFFFWVPYPFLSSLSFCVVWILL